MKEKYSKHINRIVQTDREWGPNGIVSVHQTDPPAALLGFFIVIFLQM